MHRTLGGEIPRSRAWHLPACSLAALGDISARPRGKTADPSTEAAAEKPSGAIGRSCMSFYTDQMNVSYHSIKISRLDN